MARDNSEKRIRDLGNEEIEEDAIGRRGRSPRSPEDARGDAFEALAELTRRLMACLAVAIVVDEDGAAAFDPAGFVPADLPRDPHALADPLTAESLGFGFYAAVPVRLGDRDLGTVSAIDAVPREFREEELEALKMAARVAAALIDPRQAGRG